MKNRSNWLLEIAIIVLLLGNASFGADKTNKEKTVHNKVTVSFLSRYYQRDQHEVHNYTVTHLVVWFWFSLSAKEEELKSVETLYTQITNLFYISHHTLHSLSISDSFTHHSHKFISHSISLSLGPVSPLSCLTFRILRLRPYGFNKRNVVFFCEDVIKHFTQFNYWNRPKCHKGLKWSSKQMKTSDTYCYQSSPTILW